MREAKSKSPLFCLSSRARSPRRPSRRTAIVPPHFRFAGFSTERRFARVSRIGTSHFITFSLLSPPAEHTAENSPRGCALKGHGFRVRENRAVPKGTRIYFPLYPALRLPHPNSRKSGANRGPRLRLRAGLNSFAPAGLGFCAIGSTEPTQNEFSLTLFSRAAKPFIFVITSGRTGVPDKRSAVAGLLG